jgi:hypothetical protein
MCTHETYGVAVTHRSGHPDPTAPRQDGAMTAFGIEPMTARVVVDQRYAEGLLGLDLKPWFADCDLPDGAR